METNKIYCGDALEVLKTFPDNSIDCVVTSPPYWSLRDYKIEGVIWDGDSECEHEWQDATYKRRSKDGKACLSRWSTDSFEELRCDKPVNNAFCVKCNAWRGSLGLEPTFKLYLSHLLQVFAEVKRVLKNTGTCWINLDSTYNNKDLFIADEEWYD